MLGSSQRGALSAAFIPSQEALYPLPEKPGDAETTNV